MSSNLMKSPLVAVLFASLLFFADIFVPYGAEYTAAYADFAMPLAGRLFLIAFAFWICLIAAVVFGAADKSGLGAAGLLLVTTLGTIAVIPLAERVLFGLKPGLMDTTDTVLTSAVRAVCTIIIFVLLVLLYKTGLHYKAADPKAALKPMVEYKLKPLGFAIKMIVLPVVFCVLFYIAWYFLFWSNADVRAFYGGPVEKLGFVPSIVNSLITDSWMLLLALFKGFIYAAFALPLLFMFKGKRVIFIASTVMLYLAYPIWLLIPTPFIPDNVRIPMCIYNAALLLLFGAVAGVLLHTSFAREEKIAPVHQKPLAQQQAAAKAGQGGPTAKQAAEVVSKTMSGEVK